jgi:hypothetical protein
MEGEKIKLIVVRGCQSAGKTTSIGMVYRKLFEFPQTKLDHIFNTEKVSKISLEYEKNGGVKDFNAIVTVNDVKVGIISHADYVLPVLDAFNLLKEKGVSIIVCATRSRDRENSVYRFWKEKVEEEVCEIVHEETVKRVPVEEVVGVEEVKRLFVERIVNKVVELTREINEKRKAHKALDSINSLE